MEYLVLIDRVSIKPNPRAGVREDTIPGLRTRYREIVSPASNTHHRVTRQTGVGESGPWLTVETIERPGKAEPSAREWVEQQTINVRTMGGEPEWLYNFLPLQVTCDECGQSFDWSELKSDDQGDDYSSTICPRCGEWNCCDVTFERIEDVMRETTPPPR